MNDESGKSTERCDRCRKKKVRDRDRDEADGEKIVDCRDKTKYVESSDITEREKNQHDVGGQARTT